MPSKRFFTALLLCALFASCKGCMDDGIKKPKAIKVGVIAGPENLLWETIKEVAKRDHDLDLEMVVFSDYMTPNLALSDGSVDANAFQHEPFLNEMVKNRGLKLVSVGKTFIFPLCGYSKKITSTSQLGVNATIAIPNDPTNEGRALLLLHEQGFIKLRDPTKLLSTISDIVENPLKLKIIELEAAQLPRALEDVDVAIINTTFANSAGLNPQKDALFREGRDSFYVNIIAVRSADQQAPWVKKLVDSVHNDDVVTAAETIFAGSALAGW